MTNDILTDPISVLQKYLQIDTTNSKNDREACQFWSSIFSQYDVKNHIVHSEDYHNFETYTTQGNCEKILLQNHLDVVPAHRENWKYDPFGGVIEGNYLYGRGALDMKSLAVAQAYTFLKLVKENHPRQNLIKFCSLVQEETSSEHGAKFYVEHLKTQGYRGLIVLGEGGFGLKIPEIYDGTLFLYESEQKGLLWLSITVHSKGGHGSVSGKTKRTNPVLRAAKVAEKLSSYRFPIKIEESVKDFIEILLTESHNNWIRMIDMVPWLKQFLFKTTAGTMVLYRLITYATGIPDLFRTSLSITNISTDKLSGVEQKPDFHRFSLRRIFRREPKRRINPITRLGVNIIPSYATITCDIRFNSFYTVNTLMETIRKFIPRDAELQVINSQEFSSSDCSVIHESFKSELEKIYPNEAILSPFLFIASSDNYFFRSYGHQCYGLIPIVVPLDELQRIHGDNERVHIGDFKVGCEIYYRFVKALLRDLKI